MDVNFEVTDHDFEVCVRVRRRRRLRTDYAGIPYVRHPSKFLPLEKMLKAKHSSLWSYLSFPDQEKLLLLLEQLRPEEQDFILRVMNQWKGEMTRLFDSPSWEISLLSVLKSVHSIDRSNLLRLLEQMNPQEQKKLLCVMDRLEQSQRVKLLGIENDLKEVDWSRLLRLLNGLHFKNIHPFHQISLASYPSTQCYDERLLNLLTCLRSIDQSNLLKLLDPMKPQEQAKFISVMDTLSPKESEQVELVGILDKLEALEQKIILNVLNSTYSNGTVLKLMKIFLPVDQSRLLRLLNGLIPTSQHRLLKVLEHSSQRHELLQMMDRLKTGLLDRLDGAHLYRLLKVLEHSSRRQELVEMMDRLKRKEQLQLVRMLGGADSLEESFKMVDEILKSPMRMSEVIDQFEQQRQLERVLRALGYLQQRYNLAAHNMDDARLLSKAANLIHLHLLQHGGYIFIDRSTLQQCLDGLDPVEQKQLPKALSGLNHSSLSEQVEILTAEELGGVDVCSMLSVAYELLMQMKYDSLLQRLQQLFVCLLSIFLPQTDSQGGFRNLLLDGWWLGFWEILLLAAGDVERNPGPRRMTDEELCKIEARVLGKDDLFDVYDAVYDCRPKWHNLCLALRLSPVDLSAIDKKQRGDPDACLEDGLTLWLQGHYDTDTHGPPSWRMLVDAVANSAGGDNHALAVEIAEKHKALPTVPSHDDRRFEEMSSSFNNMYRSVIQLLRNVDVDAVKEHLCYLTVPKEFDKLCVPPHVYKRAKTTKDLLGRLCPQYINPGTTFVLEEIIKKFGCRRCKRLVREYLNKFM